VNNLEHIPTEQMVNNHKLSLIIPVYNEEAKIQGVIQPARQLDEISEIIIIDDGSDDATVAKVEEEIKLDSRIRLICHPQNLGKGQAVFTGWQAAHGTYLILLDGDLLGLKPENIRHLYQPVIEEEMDMTVGVFRNGYWRTDISQKLAPWLSGQRCLRYPLLSELSLEAAAGYGIETALTVAAQTKGWQYKYVPLDGVWHIPIEDRRGGFGGVGAKSKMYLQIIRAWYISRGLKNSSGKPVGENNKGYHLDER
jgi:glycosyltransferase involved in cell wall biosynthesis